MPRFRPACVRQATIAALALFLALLSGCGAGLGSSAGGHPVPFALGLPTPTNTPGSALAAPTAAAPSTAAVAPTPTSTQASQSSATPTSVSTAAPTTAAPATPTLTVVQEGEVDETPSPQALTATSAPDAQATPTSASQAPATPTGEPAETATLNPIPTGTPAPGGDTTPTAAAPTRTWTSAPTPTPDLPPPDWDLARDVIGLWEYVEGDWRYCFDFFPDGRVSILGNGIRTYQVRDPRTLVIQVLEDEWVYPVVDLTYDHLTLEGVIDPAAQFARVEGTSNLADALVGLWLDLSGEFPSFEFTEEGVVVGEFGRGRYEVASPNSVLVTCDVPKDCAGYLVPGQPDGTPFAVRIYQVDDRSLSLQGLDRGQVWTIDRRGGYANLATGILGRWVNDGGSSVEFTEGGDWIVDDVRYGVYEVLSDSTIWGVLEGAGQALVITELTGTQLRYAEWGRFYMEDQRVYYRDPNSP